MGERHGVAVEDCERVLVTGKGGTILVHGFGVGMWILRWLSSSLSLMVIVL